MLIKTLAAVAILILCGLTPLRAPGLEPKHNDGSGHWGGFILLFGVAALRGLTLLGVHR